MTSRPMSPSRPMARSWSPATRSATAAGTSSSFATTPTAASIRVRGRGNLDHGSPLVDLVAMALQPDGRIVAGGIAARTDRRRRRHGARAVPGCAGRTGLHVRSAERTGRVAGVDLRYRSDRHHRRDVQRRGGNVHRRLRHASDGTGAGRRELGTHLGDDARGHLHVDRELHRDHRSKKGRCRSTSSPSSRPTVRAPSPRRDGTPSSRFPTMTRSVGSTDAGG